MAQLFGMQERRHEVEIRMSIVTNLASGVEMTLLKRILARSMSAVGVATLPG